MKSIDYSRVGTSKIAAYTYKNREIIIKRDS